MYSYIQRRGHHPVTTATHTCGYVDLCLNAGKYSGVVAWMVQLKGLGHEFNIFQQKMGSLRCADLLDY
jgi:hypothetical protein